MWRNRCIIKCLIKHSLNNFCKHLHFKATFVQWSGPSYSFTTPTPSCPIRERINGQATELCGRERLTDPSAHACTRPLTQPKAQRQKRPKLMWPRGRLEICGTCAHLSVLITLDQYIYIYIKNTLKEESQEYPRSKTNGWRL